MDLPDLLLDELDDIQPVPAFLAAAAPQLGQQLGQLGQQGLGQQHAPAPGPPDPSGRTPHAHEVHAVLLAGGTAPGWRRWDRVPERDARCARAHARPKAVMQHSPAACAPRIALWSPIRHVHTRTHACMHPCTHAGATARAPCCPRTPSPRHRES